MESSGILNAGGEPIPVDSAKFLQAFIDRSAKGFREDFPYSDAEIQGIANCRLAIFGLEYLTSGIATETILRVKALQPNCVILGVLPHLCYADAWGKERLARRYHLTGDLFDYLSPHPLLSSDGTPVVLFKDPSGGGQRPAYDFDRVQLPGLVHIIEEHISRQPIIDGIVFDCIQGGNGEGFYLNKEFNSGEPEYDPHHLHRWQMDYIRRIRTAMPDLQLYANGNRAWIHDSFRRLFDGFLVEGFPHNSRMDELEQAIGFLKPHCPGFQFLPKVVVLWATAQWGDLNACKQAARNNGFLWMGSDRSIWESSLN